ncbi:MAG: hypothetical protein WCG66_07915 [bacterium]
MSNGLVGSSAGHGNMATELIKGNPPQEALSMSGEALSEPLGPLPRRPSPTASKPRAA